MSPTRNESHLSAHRRTFHARLAHLMVCAIALTAGAPHAARAGLNVWTSNGPDAPGVNALASGIVGVVPFYGAGAPASVGIPIPIVYAGTAGEGVFRSLDQGASWQAVNAGLEHTYIESLLVDASRLATVYATSPNRGVFKSDDAGNTWMAMSSGLPSPSAHLMAADLGSGILYVTSNDGLFASRDGAESWSATALRTRRYDSHNGDVSLNAWIDCLAADSMTAAVYACFLSWDNGPGPSWQLLKSSDAGETWQGVALPTAGGPVAIAIDRGMPDTVYVATYDPVGGPRVLKSSNGGAEWVELGGALPGCDSFCRIAALAVDTRGVPLVYAATDRGVYAIGDGDAAWRTLNTGMVGLSIDSIAVDDVLSATVYAGTSTGAFSIFRQPEMCAGDCNGDGRVRVSELVAMVGIAHDEQAMAACGAGDSAGDGHIAVDDIVTAVGSALTGCRAAHGMR